jgi:hypothetical protein
MKMDSYLDASLLETSTHSNTKMIDAMGSTYTQLFPHSFPCTYMDMKRQINSEECMKEIKKKGERVKGMLVN